MICCPTQGISEPSLRYTAGRVAQEVCSALGSRAMEFMKPLFVRCCIAMKMHASLYNLWHQLFRLQSWYKVWKKQYESEPVLTEDRKYHFINLALFYAEVFVRVQTVSDEMFHLNYCVWLCIYFNGLGWHSIQRIGTSDLWFCPKVAWTQGRLYSH